MVKLVRTIHLYTALLLGVYVLMYAASGLVMIHPDWFSNRDTETTQDVAVARDLSSQVSSALTPEARMELSRQLAGALSLRGRAEAPRRQRNGAWLFVYRRPGTVERLHLRAGAESATLSVQKANFAGVLNRFHHLDGYGGGLRFTFWALLLDIVSLAMILFALSGIYLWYKYKRNRGLGWLILGGSTAYVIGSIFFLLLRA